MKRFFSILYEINFRSIPTSKQHFQGLQSLQATFSITLICFKVFRSIF